MTQITKAQRAALVAWIDRNTSYDVDTVRVSRDGMVTAKLDADKTFAGPHNDRLNVGGVNELLAEMGGE